MSLLIFESKTVLDFKVIRKVTHKDLSEVKRREKNHTKNITRLVTLSGTTLHIFWDLSVPYTYFNKITQMAQQYNYCVLLLCTHAMRKKAFILQIENQLVLREGINITEKPNKIVQKWSVQLEMLQKSDKQSL